LSHSTRLALATISSLCLAASASGQAWQIDFQGDAGGAFSSADPITSTWGGAWNPFQIPATNAALDNAVSDPIFFAQGSSSMSLDFTFSGLPEGMYRFTGYDGTTVDVIPAEPDVDFSAAGNSASLAGIQVGSSGLLAGTFDAIGGDPSISAVTIERLPEPSASALPALVTLALLGWRRRRGLTWREPGRATRSSARHATRAPEPATDTRRWPRAESKR
jgi:hypothetical protein